MLSNHFPAKFTKPNDQSFNSTEHFLVVRRAELSGNEAFIMKALNVQDPVQAKHILNALHNDHQEQWDSQLDQLVMEGLRAKFTQNAPLRDYLKSTGKLILGEASGNPRWGIGMDLNNPKVLEPTEWLEAGNLLGRSLMKLITELNQRKNASSGKGHKQQRKGPGNKN